MILVTGGTGTLGRYVVADLVAEGHAVRLLSRRTAPPSPPVAWFTGDLRQGRGLEAALDGVDIVVHCATGRGDRTAAGNLITAAVAAGRPHLVYISIVGVDRIPVGYYRAKWTVEQMIVASGLPHTILRATQFHELIATGARALTRLPVAVLPRGLQFQPIAAREVASRLATLATEPPAQRVADMAGPEVARAEDLVRAYARSVGRRRLVVTVPVPGKVMAALRRGRNLAPEQAVGRQTFQAWLTAH